MASSRHCGLPLRATSPKNLQRSAGRSRSSTSAQECKAVRTSVGCLEISGYAKYEITGPGAEGWLSHLLANKVPNTGRMTLAPMLNEAGKLIGDFYAGQAG
jgi:glycine cleavage system aminomethyltransferase T